jgi:hypothetical protein
MHEMQFLQKLLALIGLPALHKISFVVLVDVEKFA